MWTLLTGGTGFVGKQVLRGLLNNGHKVVVLIRAKTSHEAAKKWHHQIYDKLPLDQMPQVLYAHGDLFDLTTCERFAYSEGIKRIVHCAGDVSFGPHNQCHHVNVNGLRNLLDLTRKYSVEEFHHVSTAYVCGAVQGSVYELRRNEFATAKFKNAYEKSKHDAELLVYKNSVLCPWLHTTIYRPTVVVGSEVNGATTCFNGFYQLVRAAWNLSKACHSGLITDKQIRLPFTGLECVNLVPVDHVSRVINHVVSNPEHQRKIYHVTPSQPMNAFKVMTALLGYFREKMYKLPEVVPVGSIARKKMTTLEKMLEVWLGPYAPYFATDPSFNTDNTDAAILGKYILSEEVFIPRIVEYAIATNFGRNRL